MNETSVCSTALTVASCGPINFKGHELVRNAKPENVSKELLSVCLDLDHIVEANPCDARSFLFDDSTVEYLWNYDNNGLKVAQVYFLGIPQQIGLDP